LLAESVLINNHKSCLGGCLLFSFLMTTCDPDGEFVFGLNKFGQVLSRLFEIDILISINWAGIRKWRHTTCPSWIRFNSIHL